MTDPIPSPEEYERQRKEERKREGVLSRFRNRNREWNVPEEVGQSRQIAPAPPLSDAERAAPPAQPALQQPAPTAAVPPAVQREDAATRRPRQVTISPSAVAARAGIQDAVTKPVVRSSEVGSAPQPLANHASLQPLATVPIEGDKEQVVGRQLAPSRSASEDQPQHKIDVIDLEPLLPILPFQPRCPR